MEGLSGYDEGRPVQRIQARLLHDEEVTEQGQPQGWPFAGEEKVS